MELPDETIDDLQKRLRRIEGQVRGIAGMVADDRYCIDVLQQISAAQAALDKVALALVDERLGNGCGRDFLGLVRIRAMQTRRVLMSAGEIIRREPNPAWEALLLKPFTSAELQHLLGELLK